MKNFIIMLFILCGLAWSADVFATRSPAEVRKVKERFTKIIHPVSTDVESIIYMDPDWADYTEFERFYIQSISILLPGIEMNAELKKEIKNAKNYFRSVISRGLIEAGFYVDRKPRKNALTIELIISGLTAQYPASGEDLFTHAYFIPAQKSSVSLEGHLIERNELKAIVVSRMAGAKLKPKQRVQNRQTVYAAFDRWAKNFVKAVQRARLKRRK